MRPFVRLIAPALALAASLAGRAQDVEDVPNPSPRAAPPKAASSPSAAPAAPGAGEPRPPLFNRFGEVLRRPRILAFDGETFQVEHADGVAALPWDALPEAWRRGFQRDPARAAAGRQAQQQRRQILDEQRAAEEARRRETVPAPPPERATVIERQMRLGDLYLLPTIGGPEGELRIWDVSQTDVTFERRRYAWQTVPKTLGFDSPRTLLFDDGRGCRVYYVDRPRRAGEDRYSVPVQFEYAPGREPPGER